MKKLFTFILLFSLIKAFPCLNEIHVHLDGTTSSNDYENFIPSGKPIDVDYYQKKFHEADSLWQADKKIEDYINSGVYLVYLGQYKEAKEIFIYAEETNPGWYEVAANLGTVYELLGDNENALKWIKKAVDIDPNSHSGSEWIHINIIKAKIKGDSYQTADFLIGTNFGNEDIPFTDLSPNDAASLANQISYQLKERMTFIGPKDKIIAILLFELGNIYATMNNVTAALRIYDKAIEYGYSSELLNRRYNNFLKIHKNYNHKELIEPTFYLDILNDIGLTHEELLILSIILILILIPFGIYIYRKFIKK